MITGADLLSKLSVCLSTIGLSGVAFLLWRSRQAVVRGQTPDIHVVVRNAVDSYGFHSAIRKDPAFEFNLVVTLNNQPYGISVSKERNYEMLVWCTGTFDDNRLSQFKTMTPDVMNRMTAWVGLEMARMRIGYAFKPLENSFTINRSVPISPWLTELVVIHALYEVEAARNAMESVVILSSPANAQASVPELTTNR